MTLEVRPKNAGTIGSGDIPFQLDVEMGDFVIGGLKVSTNASQSTAITIASGSSVLKGFHIDEDATGSLAVATSATNFIFIVLTLNASNKPTAVSYVATTAETQTNGYRLAKVVSTTKVDTVAMHHGMIPATQVALAHDQLRGLF